MRNTIHSVVVFAVVAAASLALAACPEQPSYPSTIIPIYAATSAGLSIYNGSGWTSYTAPGALKTLIVSGSGSGAIVLVGGNNGVSELNGSTWTTLNSGLGSTTVNSLTNSASVYASTAGGLSVLNSDGTWANNASVTPVNDAFLVGAYTLVAGGTGGAAGLYVYNGTALVLGAPIPSATIVPTSTSVTSVFVDVSGDLIVGTDKGVGIQYATTGTPSWSNPPISVSVNRVYADRFGNIYAATGTGLYIIDTTVSLALSGTVVNCVCVDGAGTIYAGTSTGLQVSRDGGFTWSTVMAGANVTSVATTAPLYSF